MSDDSDDVMTFDWKLDTRDSYASPDLPLGSNVAPWDHEPLDGSA